MNLLGKFKEVLHTPSIHPPSSRPTGRVSLTLRPVSTKYKNRLRITLLKYVHVRKIHKEQPHKNSNSLSKKIIFLGISNSSYTYTQGRIVFADGEWTQVTEVIKRKQHSTVYSSLILFLFELIFIEERICTHTGTMKQLFILKMTACVTVTKKNKYKL